MLERELAKGAVAHGRPDQTWTLSRINTMIGRRFHKSCTVQGVAALDAWLVFEDEAGFSMAPPTTRTLMTAVRRGLRQLPYRPDVLDGCLTGTGTGLRRQPPP
ncbi:hypothetical protein QFZ66_008391 [Streptomyces sp. B4I13]|uniref:hypothetical protein n=1 Tax=Streptomyces sp. B4I13 TaxID=3042271 RepID=UPI00278B3149|nr:hypothetical protein [Streptomyces sp. B4I13]